MFIAKLNADSAWAFFSRSSTFIVVLEQRFFYESKRSQGEKTLPFNGDKTYFSRSLIYQLLRRFFIIQIHKENTSRIEALAINS